MGIGLRAKAYTAGFIDRVEECVRFATEISVVRVTGLEKRVCVFQGTKFLKVHWNSLERLACDDGTD